MSLHLRATCPEEKEQRRHLILDAAERLWLDDPERMANIAEIAQAAGLAKGTLYLYFRSKEELLLAMHERHNSLFFDSVIQRAGQDGPMAIEDMIGMIRGLLIATPAFLPLATLCHGLMERHISLEIAYAFEERTHAHLDRVVAALQRHFPLLTQALMLQSYALILGLWQLLRPSPLKELMRQRELVCACTDDYLNALDQALRALWRGALSPEG